ncbi:11993_t:CDS:2 [Funneliformis geosporum]|uniref:11993_t:CDS:1 n=1 Tax=Funneliformis geosporum TaxID=1117311 RepID=A0A9W4SW19_9GLOM|nr:11993_t:CDS:2 [Funneliformis geosporum]
MCLLEAPKAEIAGDSTVDGITEVDDGVSLEFLTTLEMILLGNAQW